MPKRRVNEGGIQSTPGFELPLARSPPVLPRALPSNTGAPVIGLSTNYRELSGPEHFPHRLERFDASCERGHSVFLPLDPHRNPNPHHFEPKNPNMWRCENPERVDHCETVFDRHTGEVTQALPAERRPMDHTAHPSYRKREALPPQRYRPGTVPMKVMQRTSFGPICRGTVNVLPSEASRMRHGRMMQYCS